MLGDVVVPMITNALVKHGQKQYMRCGNPCPKARYREPEKRALEFRQQNHT